MDPTQVKTSQKPARTEKPQVVLCFMNSDDDYRSLSYSFEFFPLQTLLNYKKYPQLNRYARPLTWPDNVMDDSACPNMCMSFRHSRLSLKEDHDDGLGVLYAVGGLTIPDYAKLGSIPKSLPNKLTRITLSGYRMLNDCDTYMTGGKLFPLIEEIDDLIYVLSGPTNCFGPNYKESKNTFEVYSPRDDEWRILAELPLASSPNIRRSPFKHKRKYAHLVLGRKLFVSDGLYSCVYDIASNTWNACHLFSDCYIPGDLIASKRVLLPGCGPGFPFDAKALLWKDKFLLCIMPKTFDFIMAAFRIDKGEEGGCRT